MQGTWKVWQEAPPEAQVALDAATEGLAAEPSHPGFAWAQSTLKNEAPQFRPDGPEPGVTWAELARVRGDTCRVSSRYLEPNTGIVLNYVPPGKYFRGATRKMGEINSDATAHASEGPVHEVTLTRGFFLGRTTVTVKQYQCFLMDTGREAPRTLLPDLLNVRPDQPVVGVTWYHARAFTDWLSRKTSLDFGLPSEAQWEFAARGTDGRRHPWGRRTAGREFIHQGERVPQDVGMKPAGMGPFGHLDMLGNVQEFCEDLWEEYSQNAIVNPLNRDEDWREFQSDALRVVRGCAIHLPAHELRVTARSAVRPSHFFPWLGFRVLLWEKPPLG